MFVSKVQCEADERFFIDMFLNLLWKIPHVITFFISIENGEKRKTQELLIKNLKTT